MRIKKGFVHRSLCGEHVVLGEGLDQVNFNKILSLNDSAAYLWDSVVDLDFTEETLVDLLLDKYEVTEQVAAADAHKLIETFRQQGVIE